jgi:hypothetical protein
LLDAKGYTGFTEEDDYDEFGAVSTNTADDGWGKRMLRHSHQRLAEDIFIAVKSKLASATWPPDVVDAAALLTLSLQRLTGRDDIETIAAITRAAGAAETRNAVADAKRARLILLVVKATQGGRWEGHELSWDDTSDNLRVLLPTIDPRLGALADTTIEKILRARPRKNASAITIAAAFAWHGGIESDVPPDVWQTPSWVLERYRKADQRMRQRRKR